MSILHDSLQRLERAGNIPNTPWSLALPSKGVGQSGLLSRKSLIMLAALAILSLAAWSVVSLWPMPTPRTAGTVSKPPAGASVQFPVRAKVESRRASSTQQPETSMVQVQRTAQQETPASLPGIGPKETLDHRMLTELNAQLSSLLTILTLPGPDEQRSPKAPLDRIELRANRGEGGEWSMQPSEWERHALATEPMVHVSVRSKAAQADLRIIRQVEESLGQALRDRDWPVFDQKYQRLASLKPFAGNTLNQWQAAKAMALADYPEAQRILEMLRQTNPHDLHTGLNLALVYETQGRIESAREMARTLAQIHSLEPSVQSLLDRLEGKPGK